MKLSQKLLRLDQNGQSRLILIAALCVTAIILFLVLPNLTSLYAGRYSVAFADGYDSIANNLVHGNGYRSQAGMAETMIREPGYPLLLAAIFLVAGYHIEPVRLVNWILMFGIAFMLMHLARLVTKDKRTALIASLLFVLHPGTLIAEARAGVEILFIFSVLAFMLVLYRTVEKGYLLYYLASGLLFGAVLEVRGTPLMFPALLLLYLGLAAKGIGNRLKVVVQIAVFAIGMAIVAAPWVIRNYFLTHEFVPGGSIRGIALQGGQFACRNLSFTNEYKNVLLESGSERAELARELGIHVKDVLYAEPLFYDAKDELTLSNALVKRGMNEYFNDPGFFASCMGKNAFFFFFLGKTWPVTGLNILIQLPVLILALSGLCVLQRRCALDKMSLMLMFVLSIVMVHLPTVAEARYSLPTLPFLAIPASVSIVWLWDRRRVSTRRECRDEAAAIPERT